MFFIAGVTMVLGAVWVFHIIWISSCASWSVFWAG